MKQIGIYAGTFDPIHDGHMSFAFKALEHGLDKVFFLVEPQPRRKQGVRALEHRQGMVAASIAEHDKLGLILSDQPQFTPHETLPPLQERFKGAELVLLFGDDVISHMVDHMATWPQVDQLAETAKLLVAARYHSQVRLTKRLEQIRALHDLPLRYEFVDPGAEDISSSQIRGILKRGQTPKHMPAPALLYAQQHKLYIPQQ